MRKKFRKIVIDGDASWAWNCTKRDSYYRYNVIKIWKDKQAVFEKAFGGESCNRNKRYKITPGLISRFIKLYLKKNEK